MQRAILPAFEQKIAVLAALLERRKSARIEAHAKVGQQGPRYQASGKGGRWSVVEIATNTVQGFAYTYQIAMQIVDALEADAASERCGVKCLAILDQHPSLLHHK